MRGLVRGLGVACAMLMVVGACQANAAPPAESQPAGVVSAEATITSTIETSSAPPAVESPGCDPIDELFARMFVGLSEAALSNSGIQPEAFFAALATNRETLKRYLETLGIPADDAQIDAAMSAALGERLLRHSPDVGNNAQTGGTWVICK